MLNKTLDSLKTKWPILPNGGKEGFTKMTFLLGFVCVKFHQANMAEPNTKVRMTRPVCAYHEKTEQPSVLELRGLCDQNKG